MSLTCLCAEYCLEGSQLVLQHVSSAILCGLEMMRLNRALYQRGSVWWRINGACACRGVDFGSVYASKTFQLRNGRRVLLGWVYETAAGCEAECSTGTNFTYSLVSGASSQLACIIDSCSTRELPQPTGRSGINTMHLLC